MHGASNMDALFKPKFPNLSGVAQKKTSEIDPKYNCIAWAFGDNQKHWWPDPKRSYWPLALDGTKTVMQAFEELFATDGWELTQSTAVEEGYEKIAFFALNGVPKHAARLLPTGQWTSKLGQHIDLSHGLNDLDGPEYGQIIGIYRKKIT